MGCGGWGGERVFEEELELFSSITDAIKSMRSSSLSSKGSSSPSPFPRRFAVAVVVVDDEVTSPLAPVIPFLLPE